MLVYTRLTHSVAFCVRTADDALVSMRVGSLALMRSPQDAGAGDGDGHTAQESSRAPFTVVSIEIVNMKGPGTRKARVWERYFDADSNNDVRAAQGCSAEATAGCPRPLRCVPSSPVCADAHARRPRSIAG